MTFEPTNDIPGEDDDQPVPHQQQRDGDDTFCPHTAYPLQVTLTLIEGDMTVRHTECGRAVLTDWPYLRANDVPLTLAYAIDDQDEDWLELRLPAGLDEWLQDEQQPDEATGGEQVQDGAAGRVRAAVDDEADVLGAMWELFPKLRDDLRAVLAERDQMAKLLGIGVAREQWDAVAEAEGRRFEGEQINDTLVGYLAYQRESLRALNGFLQSEVKELESERDALAARVAELEAYPALPVRADREADEADVRAVDAVAAAGDDELLDRAISNLIARFADRIAALNATETEES
jgi:hypothetical protein